MVGYQMQGPGLSPGLYCLADRLLYSFCDTSFHSGFDQKEGKQK